MQKTNIAPEIFQSYLESASNAGNKGQAAYFTPIEFGREAAAGLPPCRPTVVDLNCGSGQLLRACANATTKHRFGLDIDSAMANAIQGDLTLVYPLFVDVDWRGDLFVLNPPWDLHWFRDRLAPLAQSKVVAVRSAYAAHDGRTAAGTIDATIATFCIALDRLSDLGEGLLIANASTMDRLIFGPGAPHAPLARHVWARITIPGNPMTGDLEARGVPIATDLIYFSRRMAYSCFTGTRADLPTLRSRHTGPEIMSEFHGDPDGVVKWQAVAVEWKARQKPARTDYHLWLAPDGTIRTALSLFDQHGTRNLKAQADELHRIAGKRPMQLVMQRGQREALLALTDAAAGSPWRVEPTLHEAVVAAVAQYHACRAPLYALEGFQRLAYLEEQDSIVCKRDLGLTP